MAQPWKYPLRHPKVTLTTGVSLFNSASQLLSQQHILISPEGPVHPIRFKGFEKQGAKKKSVRLAEKAHAKVGGTFVIRQTQKHSLKSLSSLRQLNM